MSGRTVDVEAGREGGGARGGSTEEGEATMVLRLLSALDKPGEALGA